MSKLRIIYNGLVAENPTFVLLLGMGPRLVRIPAYIVVIATFVTLLQMFMQAYLPALNESLGIFIPLIVVNCILLGRAEAYASKHTVGDSLLDGVGVGLGFTVALTLLGSVRELFGAGTVFDVRLFPETYGSLVFVLAPGAFIALGFLIALINHLLKRA